MEEKLLLFCKKNEKDPSICTSRVIISFHSPPVRVHEDYPPAQYEARDSLERIWVGKRFHMPIVTSGDCGICVVTGLALALSVVVKKNPVGLANGRSDK